MLWWCHTFLGVKPVHMPTCIGVKVPHSECGCWCICAHHTHMATNCDPKHILWHLYINICSAPVFGHSSSPSFFPSISTLMSDSFSRVVPSKGVIGSKISLTFYVSWRKTFLCHPCWTILAFLYLLYHFFFVVLFDNLFQNAGKITIPAFHSCLFCRSSIPVPFIPSFSEN